MKLSPTETFKGKKIFFIGGTGFVGKVTLSMLLNNFPDVGRVYATVRARDANESKIRFWTSIVTSPTFDPLREKYGEGFEDFIKSKVVPVNGDVGNELLGLDEKEAKKIMRDTDIIINGAGNVTFNPPLESALRTNVVGSNNIIKMARMMKKPRLVHVSTCFVAGKRSGAIWENEPVVGYFPRKDELIGTKFDVNREVEDCARLSEQARQEADDAVQAAKFREQARKRFIDEGRDPDDEAELKSAIFRERKMWIRERTTELGAERAEYWGWTNIYTYSKSLAEQIIAQQEDIVKILVRPSIVESSQAYPFPGWNEGFTTTAPLILIALRGQPIIPVNEKLILDVIPVDMVSGAILAAAMNALVDDKPPLVFQASSGDSNPNDMKRIVGLVGLYKRQHFEDKETGNKLVNKLAGMVETQTVTQRTYELASAPMLNRLSQQVDKVLGKASPEWGGGRIGNIISDLKKSTEEFKKTTQSTIDAFAMFKPFMIDNEYLYRSDNVRALQGVIKEREKHLLPWYPERLDWYDYWLNVHFPGMRKWVLPTLEEELKAVEKRSYTYKDLIDLFETSVKRFPTRVAMRIERDGRKEQYTYEDVRELTLRAAGFLAANGVGPGSRVILFSNNMPEWGMTYFGILKAGATAIPIDPASSADEIANFVRAGEASAIIMSPKLAEEWNENDDVSVPIWTFEDVFQMQTETEEARRNALLPAKVHSGSIASLIFTSGTTGVPKAVMLSHKNFVNMISMLSSVLDMDITDGVLSVLPMHHTFEFSAGFLTPFSNGTQITYLNELTAEDLSKTIKNGHVTGMVGVPALWEMLHRRIKTRLREKGDWIADMADNMIEFNAWIRDNTPFNLGPIVFLPIHEGMGGKMRYLISGGSALSEKVQKDLHGLGFTVLEGYGLTESSPVLTVARPGKKLLKGSVGKPLPGVEVKIDSPDENGVGEVLARGQNVMVGYYNNEKATEAVMQDRWLRTGDLGRLDDDGNLYIVGRSKDVIIDSNGKNIYPDEIEDRYGKSSFIKELSVVGLPDDDGGEKIACLVVPDYEHDIALSRAEANKQIELHFREVSAGLPFFKRVKVLQITPFELPRTATRKVKRPLVVEMLQQLEERSKSKVKAVIESRGDDNVLWIRKVVASVSNRPLSDIAVEDKLADLGFDSLMFVELQAAVEDSGGRLISPDTLNEVQTVRELLTAVQRVDRTKKLADEPRSEDKKEESDEIVIPSIVRRLGNSLVDLAQNTLYEGVLKTQIDGEANVPQHVNFIVAPNHTSHLDTGLVKKALGKDVAEQTVAVAAADYWFDTKYKRAYMNNFTTLVPIERTGSLRQSLRHVTQILNDGYNALIFPEGGRQESGQIAEFKPIIGYLALNQKIGILPIYIWGTYEAFPKGTVIPKGSSLGAKVGAKVGHFLEFEELQKMTQGVPNAEAYRLIAARVQHEIENMRDGRRDKFNVAAVRKAWKAERRRSRKQEPVIDE
jgi:long-chain acyl-CoA synthetase